MKNPDAYSKEPTTCASDVQARWRSPSNIALVKYWGKKGPQIPANPSLSITLSACYTETSVTLQEISSPYPEVEFYLDGHLQPAFAERLQKFCQTLVREKEFLRYHRLVVHSHNTFPHSAGIASSASGMSAFCLCLASLEEKITGGIMGDFFREASRLARRASGSASRSVYGGYVVWGEHPDAPGSSDEFAIPAPWDIYPLFHGLNDWIVVCDSGEKAVSSRAGHTLMEGHPYAQERFRQAARNISLLRQAMESGDWEAFAYLTEHEALTLHAMMLTSRPWFMLMKPQTLAVLEALRKFREQTGTQLCFTLDAGPNVHLLFPDSELDRVNELLMSPDWLHLSPESIICDREGTGPVKLL